MTDKQTQALKLALEALELVRVSGLKKPATHMEAIGAIREALAEQPAQQQVPTLYIYRQPDGSTHVMAPNIDDPALVIDMLEEGIRAMTEGQPIIRN